MAEEPPYIVDLSWREGEEPADGDSDPPGKLAERPWLGVRFDCCSVYTRIYRNRQGTAYEGRCPKCLRPVRLRVGPDGTSARFFRAE